MQYNPNSTINTQHLNNAIYRNEHCLRVVYLLRYLRLVVYHVIWIVLFYSRFVDLLRYLDNNYIIYVL
jgi:hypothetical protein